MVNSFSDIYDSTGTNVAFNKCKEILTWSINSICPLQYIIKDVNKKNNKSWVTNEIIEKSNYLTKSFLATKKY